MCGQGAAPLCEVAQAKTASVGPVWAHVRGRARGRLRAGGVRVCYAAPKRRPTTVVKYLLRRGGGRCEVAQSPVWNVPYPAALPSELLCGTHPTRSDPGTVLELRTACRPAQSGA